MTDDRSLDGVRLALYSGLCARHDAISNALRLKLDSVDRWRAAGSQVTATAFVHRDDYHDPRIRVVDGVTSLLRLPEFRAANVHVFEFGIYYPLFDAVFAVQEDASIIGAYHNVTPPALADDPVVRASLERSMVQRYNLSRADHVIVDSDYSRDELVALGFPPGHVSVIALPPATGIGRHLRLEVDRSGPVEVLFVGRFVRSKGVLDLLDAVASLGRVGHHAFRLTLVGNPTLSSAAVLDEVRRRCDGDLADVVRLVLAPDEAALAALYAQSDIFVIPSYHEGYCVPVVEALASGCHVVAYDSSNLPFVLAGLGTLVPTGDVGMLAAALAESIERFSIAREAATPVRVPTAQGDLEEAAWRAAVRAHLDGCSELAFDRRFRRVLQAVSARSSGQALAGVS